MNGRKWKIAAVSVICLLAMVSLGYGQDPDVKGEVRFRYDWIGVDGDEGRFREDNWMTDRSTGGLDYLHIESLGPDVNGYEYILKGKALYDYDYDLHFLLKKQDSHYIKLDFSSDRRYTDGSNEFWTPSGINLAELSDHDFYVDRRNYNIELGLTPPEGLQWIFGWHRLVKDGKEVLLHGARANAESNPRVYGIPTVLNVRGITDTVYGEVFWTAVEKYNFRIRQEWEQYHSDNYTNWQYRDADGSFTGADKGDITQDDLGYTNWRTMFMFDSFLDDETYVTANYMYDYLNSNSTQNNLIGPASSRSHDYRTVSGGISRRTNVTGLGYRKANVLQVPSLDFSAGIRVEDSRTSGSSAYITAASSTPTTTESTLDEVRVAESLRLVYKGLERTTLSFDVDLEQRDLDWDGNYDGATASGNLDRKSDIDFTDQEYTLKAVHRHSNAMKSTVKYRIIDKERSLTNRYLGRDFLTDNDGNPDPKVGYPGWLGSYRRTGNDLTLKTDFRHNSKTSSTLMYQYVQESIDFSLGGKTSDLQIHRGLGSVSVIPKENLFVTGTFMLENSALKTPAAKDSTSYGVRPSDYTGSSYTLMLDGTYAFNADTSCTFGVQHTEGLGQINTENGAYVYDTISLGLNHKLSANRTIGLGYNFYKFDNQASGSGSFDDYDAHGAFVTYGYTF